MRTPDVRNERGIALVIAIVALVVIAAIVSGTFFISRVERQTTSNTVLASQAFQAAEAGIQRTIADWQIGWNTMPVGATTPTIHDVLAANLSADRQISKLNDRLFLVTSTGSRYGATQTLGAVLRLVPVNVDVQAAVTAGGDVQIGGSTTVRGEDTPPSNWFCTPEGTLGGIRSSGDVQPNGSDYTLTGSPPADEFDAIVSPQTFQAPFDELKTRANITIGAGLYNGMAPTLTATGRCNMADTKNWGEPWRLPAGGVVSDCVTYAPIILATGNIRLQDGRGQGILLVDGDLEIRGGVEFTGLVIVTGKVKTNGTGSKITGAVLASQVDLQDDSSFLGNPTVSYSACALAYVLNATALARPLPGRAFAHVYN
ncbi:MAG TPA: pilus assembly PilX N-terminal domain-containing protein [Gemmatimonadales bacterium]|nr:pilus assembly PilX N-terminal domain-containing protein [Gemmatimonadales bacterium]